MFTILIKKGVLKENSESCDLLKNIANLIESKFQKEKESKFEKLTLGEKYILYLKENLPDGSLKDSNNVCDFIEYFSSEPTMDFLYMEVDGFEDVINKMIQTMKNANMVAINTFLDKDMMLKENQSSDTDDL